MAWPWLILSEQVSAIYSGDGWRVIVGFEVILMSVWIEVQDLRAYAVSDTLWDYNELLQTHLCLLGL